MQFAALLYTIPVDDIPELVSLASNIDLSDTHQFIEVRLLFVACQKYVTLLQNHWFGDAASKRNAAR